jgi:hypothetical protein
MSSNNSDAAAWERVRDRVSETATEYRQQGDTVLEVFADHSTLRRPSDQSLTFCFTVPDDTISELQKHIREDVRLDTEIRYVDVEGTRLYVLEAHDEHTNLRILIAGGIRHRSLRQVSDENGPARTVVRSITDTIPLELYHSSMAPFLVGVE